MFKHQRGPFVSVSRCSRGISVLKFPLLKVTANLRGVLSHGEQRGPREGPEMVVQHQRRQHAHGLAPV